MIAAENGHAEVVALLCDRRAYMESRRDFVYFEDVSRDYILYMCG